MTEEAQVSDEIWNRLPTKGLVPPDQVLTFLEREGLKPVVEGEESLYAYADGPREPNSPVEVEWYLEFHFEANDLSWLAVEKHLVGP